MQPVVFSTPDLFLNHFQTNSTLTLSPNQPLVIQKIESILLKGVLNEQVFNSPIVNSALYFLNRIVLPLGKTLHSNSTASSTLTIGDGKATFTNSSCTELKLIYGSIITTINDLMIRMMQTGILSVTIPTGVRICIAPVPDKEFNNIARHNEKLSTIIDHYHPPGYGAENSFGGSYDCIIQDGINILDLTVKNDFILKLSPNFIYGDPSSLGNAIRIFGGFTLPAGQTLKVESIKDRTFLELGKSGFDSSDFLMAFFNRCLAPYDLQVATMSLGGGLNWSFVDNEEVDSTFTMKMTQELKITTTKAKEIFVELKSLAEDLINLPFSERKISIGPNQRLIFHLKGMEQEKLDTLHQYFPPENINVDQNGKRLPDHLFEKTGIVGLSWNFVGNSVRFGMGTHTALNVPIIIAQTSDELTLGLISSSPANLLVDMIEEASNDILEAFLEQDPKIYRYILYQMLTRILGGSLSEFPLESLEDLELNVEVFGEINRLKNETEFYENSKIVKEKHFKEVNALFHLSLDEFDNISIDSYAVPVQKLLRDTFALVTQELRGSAFLTTHAQAAAEILAKRVAK